jgi:glycosyltransferase involved in cell wall biosynthesis
VAIHNVDRGREMKLLSVLILSIPSRFDMMRKIYEKIVSQVGSLPVEVLVLIDNKKITIGNKRTALVNAAEGKYLAFMDDDDDVSDDYIRELVAAAERDVDVIVFNELATLDGGSPFTVRCGLEYVNEPSRKNNNGQWVDIKRIPWHWCAWRSELAKTERVPDSNYGEDALWCERLKAKAKTQYRIDKVLRYYIYNRSTSEAKG